MRFFLLLLMIFPMGVFSQVDTLLLETTEIHSTRIPLVYSETSRSIYIISGKSIQSVPATSIDEVLKYALSVDVRQRGALGVQSDISIRGGSFEQYAILLNGVKLNNPQTGHHNLNLPIDLSSVKQIEILEGSGARVYGANAFTGAINIITAPVEHQNLRLNIEAGDFGYANINAQYFQNTKKISQFISLGSKSSQGYRHNTDFKTRQFFWFANLENKQSKYTFQTGYTDKSFGANSFYTPLYPEQYEHIRSFLSSLHWERKGLLNTSATVYYRMLQDRFELFREGANWYTYKDGFFIKNDTDTAKFFGKETYYKGHNYHVTHVVGADFNSWFRWKGGKTAFGINYERDIIFSNVLGKPSADTLTVLFEPNGLYNKTDNRQAVSFFVDHNLTINKFNIAAGALLYCHSSIKPVIFPGVDVSYYLTNRLNLMGSISKTLRVPSYTELYYKSPVHISNPLLKPEEALSSEIGFRYLARNIQCGATVYYHDSRNSIDWTRHKDSIKWESTNITRIQTVGNELYVKYLPKKTFAYIGEISCNFFINHLNKTDNVFLSQYVLDYLRYKGVLSTTFQFNQQLRANLTFVYQKREGSYIDFLSGKETTYKDFLTVDGKLSYTIKAFEVYLNTSNITHVHYLDIGNIPMPGRWFRAGIAYNPEKRKR